MLRGAILLLTCPLVPAVEVAHPKAATFTVEYLTVATGGGAPIQRYEGAAWNDIVRRIPQRA